jgi:glyoxylate/hydroxypyruvate reductase A
MGFNVKVWSKTKRNPKNIQYYYGSRQLHKSIKNSSCLISLLPNTSETNNIIGLSEFNLLRKECYFINVGRGMTVNEQELIYALSNAILSGAILDVFSKEPLNKKSKLWGLNNVFITPHIAGITNATDFTASLLKKNLWEIISNKKIHKITVRPLVSAFFGNYTSSTKFWDVYTSCKVHCHQHLSVHQY